MASKRSDLDFNATHVANPKAATGAGAKAAAPEAAPAASPKAGSAPTPSLPKGGGAIRGLGEKFAANLITGTGSLTVPIATSAGRAGFHPELALAYDSGGSNGPFGHGFHLSIPAISRKTDKGLPQYLDAAESDVFLLSGAEDLVPSLKKTAEGWTRDIVDTEALHIDRYRPRVEGLFSRIERIRETATGNVYWRSITKDNVTSVYGKSTNARIADPENEGRVFTWLLQESRDAYGNIVTYQYRAEDRVGVSPSLLHEKNRRTEADLPNRYVKHIRYGNRVPGEASDFLFHVVFDYGDHDAVTPTPVESPSWPARSDAFSSCRAGFEVRTYRLCKRVLMFHDMAEKLGAEPCLVSSTDFTYDTSAVMKHLVSVTHFGYVRAEGATTYTSKALPPLTFGYSQPEIHTEVKPFDAESLEHLPAGVDGQAYQWLDLDGEGIPGVLTEQAGALFYKRSLGGGRLAPAQRLSTRPSMTALSAGLPQIMDLGGDGRQDIVALGPPLAGYHERNDEGGLPPAGGGWDRFVPFRFQPNVDWNDPNLRLIDLSGDGFEDILITQDHVLLWYPSLGKEGFGAPRRFPRPSDEEKGPALVFADATRSIFLADMGGDGLQDIVRITNDEIAYWPNLGYGRFGAKVSMTDAPHFDYPERFDPRRVRLADIDGSGTPDVLYLGADGIRFWFNQSGNSWGAVNRLASFPTNDALATVAVIDLLGTGTACIVWSTPLPGVARPQMWFIDVLGSKKPHLLTSVTNNLGLETKLEYTPSTKFYLEDRLAGTPWVTRLAFPVHVLTRVESYDVISRHRFVTTYKYHHGYFDGPEREFRGFGMVEQWDTESFSAFSGTGVFPPPANATDPELHLPPVHTKTWFHTGAWVQGAGIFEQYASEYYAADTVAVRLDTIVEPIAPGDRLSAVETREAYRALKGQVLHKEVYALDGTALQPHPYVVSEQSYVVRRVQPAIGEGHGVFFVYPREAIEYHYERNAADPRVTHAFTLEVDGFGNALRSAAVGYRRRAVVGVTLPAEQEKGAITLTENEVVNKIDETEWYRVGVPVEAKTYELRAPALSGGHEVFSFADVLGAADAAVEIPYEADPGTTATKKRLLSQSFTLYYNDELTAALIKGEVESRALSYKAYAKAFTPAHLEGVFGERVTEAILTEGGYVQFDGDDDAWWAPSGRQVFSAAAFYQPVTFYDPFGNSTQIAYDGYKLAVVEATDPIGNVVAAAIDYRLLVPRVVTDPNGNRGAVAFDELGRVVATAVMGKDGSSDGDTLEAPTTTLAYAFYNPATGQPSVVHARARETHGDEETRWQESYSYSHGAGHEVMRKVQAEPGDAPQKDANGVFLHKEDGKLALFPADPRWVGTGRTVVDNKGNPVKQYEPFFSRTAAYEDEPELIEVGVTPILRYDALGRLILTDLPNGTFSKVAFDPWKQTSFDPNDTVLDPEDPENEDTQSLWYRERIGLSTSNPERRAAFEAAKHAGTPAVVHLDALGRTFLSIEDNGTAGQYETKTQLDIEGNPLLITDDRGNEPMRCLDVPVGVDPPPAVSWFAMGGRKLRQKSCDAGERWMIADVVGGMLRTWDQLGFTRRMTYDALRRPTHLYVKKDAEDEILADLTVFGEAVASPETNNLRGKPYQQYDGAGVVTSLAYDFKGNLLSGKRRLVSDYTTRVDWIDLAPFTNPVHIADEAEALLELEEFATATAYDALNRPVSMTTPDASELKPVYNEAGLLERVQVRVRNALTWSTFVDDIDYDAKGQRERIVHGEEGTGTTTEYSYDPLTYRLAQLKTTRDSDDEVLQNLGYTYDPTGNITEVSDGAQPTVFFDNAVVTASTAYVYDAIYRLIGAQGREHAGGVGLADDQRDENDTPIHNLPHNNATGALRNYTETYEYDAVGNIVEMAHDSGVSPTSWTRHYDVDETSNRLLGTSLPGDDPGEFSATYDHDVHGNMVAMPHLDEVTWDFDDQMQSADKGGGGMVYFTYDAAGQRVRKVWEHSGVVDERIYLGGYEVYRRRVSGSVTVERQTLHVMDGVKRMALVETKTVDTGAGGGFTPTTVVRMQLGNHLGSSVLEVDEAGVVISYEEYHPYGTTAYHSKASAAGVSLKRYRYTGKEKDEETGLYYYGARYYACWLGRWTAADPAGMVDGPNVYAYCGNCPITYMDPDGNEKTAAEIYYDLYQLNRQLAATVQVNGGDPRAVATVLATAQMYKRLAIQGPGGDSGVPLAAAFGGSAAFPALKPPTARADTPDSVRPLAELSNQAAPQVQAATVRGMQAGALIAMTLPGAAAGGAAPAAKVVSGVGNAAVAVVRATGPAVARYHGQLTEFVNNALASSLQGAGPMEAFAGAGVGQVAGVLLRSRTAGRLVKELEKDAGRALTNMTTGSGRTVGSSEHDIALGLSATANHSRGLVSRFAQKVNAAAYWEWQDLGLGKWNGPFDPYFLEAAKNARSIKFNLSGMDLARAARDAGDWKKAVTATELKTILESPSLLAKTTFFRDGKVLSTAQVVLEFKHE